MLGGSAARLKARAAAWPHLLDDADDITQLATLAFVEACRRGRIAVDAEAGVHTPRSVAAYAWGIVNRVFANAVRRSKATASALRAGEAPDERRYGYDLLDELLGGPDEDDDSRLWGVLSSAAQRCRAEDIIVTYLLASGVTVGEVRDLLGVSVNTPANAVKRVGRELRSVLGLEAQP